MKYFTIQEADAAIPQLEKIFASASEIRTRAQAKLETVRRLESAEGGDAARLAIEKAQLEFLAGCLESALQGIETLGALLKGLEPALVDFPCRLGGREIYLCWTAGEKRVSHFHGIEEGFAGRRPLPGAVSH